MTEILYESNEEIDVFLATLNKYSVTIFRVLKKPRHAEHLFHLFIKIF